MNIGASFFLYVKIIEIMIKFNELQKRVWNRMLRHISEYKNGEIPFSILVGSLEGELEAGEFDDKELIANWYDIWGKLETANAVALEKRRKVSKESVEKTIQEMENFLHSISLKIEI